MLISRLIPEIPKYGTTLRWCVLLSSTIIQKIKKILMSSSEKVSKNPNFWHQIKIFFKIPDLSLFLLYWPLTSSKVLEKLNERSPRYLKTDGRTNGRTDWQGRLPWTPLGKPRVQNQEIIYHYYQIMILLRQN